MPMIVANNLNALGTIRNLGVNTSNLSKSLERLSSGYRVNTASDAPASLVISEQLRAQTVGLKRAVQNTQEATNVLGIAEGALSEMNNILKKMRQLAIHSANNGITSPEQVAADQAEVDSSVQTIDRIARTTKYSDQFLLNGNKELSSDSSTYISDPRDMDLIDVNLSEIFQIAKRGGNALNIAYSDNDGKNEAQKAYFEIGKEKAAATQINSDGELTRNQSFTLSGNAGSRYFSFASGTHLGELVTSINSVKDSTGVAATLVYDADTESTKSDGNINVNDLAIANEAHSSASLDFFCKDAQGNYVSSGGITSVSLSGAAGGGGSSYGYSISSVSGAGFNTFTVGDSNNFSDVISMQFAGITAGDLENNEIYLYNDGANIIAYSDAAHAHQIGTAAIPGADDKITMNIAGGGKLYLGYSSWTAGATSLGDPNDATRPFASSLGWQHMDLGTINVEIVTEDVNASVMGLNGTTTGFDVTNIENAFNISGGADGGDIMTALNYNVQQAFAEYKEVFLKAGINVNFTFNISSPADTSALGAAIGNENTIRIAMAAFEDNTPSVDYDVVARGGYTGDPNTMYGSVVFDSNDDWIIQDNVNTYTLTAKSDSGGGGAYFYSTLMHELGHVFGFAHPSLLYGANGLMSYNNTTPNANTPYGLAADSGSIIRTDTKAWKDTFMQDALVNFYGSNATENVVVLDKATMATGAGDEIKITLTSGPAGSSIGSSTANNAAAASINADMSFSSASVSSSYYSDYDPGNVSSVLPGYNTDGFGRVYMKMTSDDDYVIYKDQAQTMKVAYGTFNSSNTTTAKELNNSGLGGLITMTRNPGEMLAGYETIIQLDYMQEDVANSTTSEAHGQGVDFTQLMNDMVVDGAAVFTSSGSYLSGVQLGKNTSDTGNIYLKGTFAGNGTDCYLAMYKDERMRDEDLVAETAHGLNLSGATAAVRFFAAETDNGRDTGLYADLNIGNVTADFNFQSVIKSTNLAARISSDEYGSDQFVTVDANEGAVWNYVDATGRTKLLDAGLSGTKHTNYGQDAVVSLNGREYTLAGLKGTVSTIDTSAELVFRQGQIGLTTIAATGYDIGAYGTRAGQMDYNGDSKYSMICHATGSTTQKLDSFTGGMQLQLGEGAGDQERTVISLQSMTAIDLGKTYDEDTGTSYSLNDLLSGGLAALQLDPVKALEVIDAAIEDVSEQRARIGAWQSNLLETNANSLNVAIENITKTESYIRDADMAYESTQFTRNQILVQAGTSMLAQANAQQQQVLSLLG